MNDITVDELYKYILNNSAKRSRLKQEDIKNDLLPAYFANKEVLAKNKDVFNYNPDTEIDHIDAVLGKPEINDKSWEEDAAYEQLPENVANKITENIAKS